MNDNYPHFDCPFIQGLYNWQTGIGAFIALAGAFLLWRQIQGAERQESDRRTRRFAAARATLPHILSEVMSFLELSMDWMVAAHSDIRLQVHLSDPPAFPASTIGALEQMIEATSVDNVAKACAEILSELQTFRARLLSVARSSRRANHVRVGLGANLEDYMLQASRIHYDVGRLFPFARAERDNVAEQLPGTSYFGSLQSLECPELAFPNVYQRANELDQRRANAAGTP